MSMTGVSRAWASAFTSREVSWSSMAVGSGWPAQQDRAVRSRSAYRSATEPPGKSSPLTLPTAAWPAPDAPILVVDDDPTILATVSEALDMEGFPVVTATNGAEALTVVQQHAPWLVLLDMRMPVLDGWGFMRVVRERGLTIPVVVMTAAADARRWAREIGAEGVLPKPFELDELLAAVLRLRPL
jgi:CheY-like chemotaxis protein